MYTSFTKIEEKQCTDNNEKMTTITNEYKSDSYDKDIKEDLKTLFTCANIPSPEDLYF